MRELRPLVARRLGVLTHPRLHRFAGLLARARTDAWPSHGLALTLARNSRLVRSTTRTDARIERERWTRIELLVRAASPGARGPEGRPGAPGPVLHTRERVELHRSAPRLAMHTVRDRVLRGFVRLERSGTELVVRHERETLRERELQLVEAPQVTVLPAHDDAPAADTRPSLVLRRVLRESPKAVTVKTLESPAPAWTGRRDLEAIPTAPTPAATSSLVPLSGPALEQLTEHVLRRIERRAIAQRERLGVV